MLAAAVGHLVQLFGFSFVKNRYSGFFERTSGRLPARSLNKNLQIVSISRVRRCWAVSARSRDKNLQNVVS